jgi:hypothetical protein
MQEYQVIQKIKKLQQIKPRNDWVVFSEKQILGPELEEKTPLFAWMFFPIRKPALVLASLFIAMALTGVFFYLNSQTPSSNILVSEDQDEAKVLSSLEGLDENLKEIKLSMGNLKNVKDQSQAVVMTEIVKSTAKEGERVVNDLKKSKEPLSDKVLASLSGIGDTYKELGETAGDTQIEMIGGLIEYLKQRTLSEEDQARLQKAEEYYNEGKYSEVMKLIPGIGNDN